MTFYEAALRVLESAGHPLHVGEITQQSISQNLLSHVGKMPEQTMLSRLAAMARRNKDRKLVVTAQDTFALVDWGIAEDTAALAVTGVPVPNPEEDLPPYRPPERHPEPRTENARATGRGEKRRRREEEEEERRGGRRRYPPAPEVCVEVLSEQNGLKAAEVLERARAKELASEQYSETQLLTALAEDNQRKIDSGRRPQFVLAKDTGLLTWESPESAASVTPGEIQAAFAEALGLPFENGRIVLRGAAAAAVAPVSAEVVEDVTVVQALKQAGRDGRRAMARVLRTRLAALEAFAFEKACVKMLHAFHFRDLKVAKRNPHGPLLTARKREGSLELRYAIRMVRGSGAVDRKGVQDLRRDMSHYAAQVGLLLTPADVRGDARSEAQSQGALALVWGGEALAEKFLEAKAGVTVQVVELFELDERFFEQVKQEADEAAHRREVRARERELEPDERPESSQAEKPAPQEAGQEEATLPVSVAGTEKVGAAGGDAGVPAPADADAEDEGEGDDEGDEGDAEGGAEAAPGTSGEVGPNGEPRRRRRRRRRGRRGRGQKPEGAPGTEGEAAAPPADGAPAATAASEPAAAAPEAAPALPASSGSGDAN
jgi:ribonuclease E